LHTIQVFVVSYIAYVVLNVAWFSFLMKDFYLEKFAGVVNAPDIELGTYFKIFSNPHLLILLAWALVVQGIIWYALPYSKGNYGLALISEQYTDLSFRVHTRYSALLSQRTGHRSSLSRRALDDVCVCCNNRCCTLYS